jgi:uncharacterized protein DUF6228
MEESVTIKSVKDATRLTLSKAVGDRFETKLESIDFSGRVIASTYVVGSPSELFDEMARDWKGWQGTKEWVPLENEMSLTASSDQTRHISLRVAMRAPCDPADWGLTATLELEAGGLAELARTVRKFFQVQP